MAEKEKDDKGEKLVGVVKQPEPPKEGAIDLTEGVELIALKDAPYHAEGEKITVSSTLAKKMLLNGWAKAAK